MKDRVTPGGRSPRLRVLHGTAAATRAVVDLLGNAAAGLSGTEIGRQIGISRAAVWKHVSHLRRNGYRIEGAPSRGYRLVGIPDRLSPTELSGKLSSKVLGRVVHYEEEVDSTNRLAREVARAGAVEGTVVIADTQTAGRGRLGRSWFSPPSVNLYLSVVLRPDIPPARAPQLALVAAGAVAASIEEVAGIRPAIKWPNDVILHGRKVAGILTEMDSEADRVVFAIVGVGVNLNVSAETLARALPGTATSLAAATGRSVDRVAFAARLLAELEQRYSCYLTQGFGALRKEWESYSCLTGHEVTVTGPEGRRQGQVIGVDQGGALCLRGAGGRTIRVLAGDVTLSKAYRRLPERSEIGRPTKDQGGR